MPTANDVRTGWVIISRAAEVCNSIGILGRRDLFKIKPCCFVIQLYSNQIIGETHTSSIKHNFSQCRMGTVKKNWWFAFFQWSNKSDWGRVTVCSMLWAHYWRTIWPIWDAIEIFECIPELARVSICKVHIWSFFLARSWVTRKGKETIVSPRDQESLTCGNWPTRIWSPEDQRWEFLPRNVKLCLTGISNAR